jgi:hypothetical protein
MSTGIDIQFVRETYKKLTDQELIRVVTQDAYGLTPEALEVVKEEIKSRNLDPNIIKGLDAQQKTYTVEEIDEYCELIRSLPCPITGSIENKLNGTMTAEVMSFILFTQYKRKIVIGSPQALDKENNSALIKTVLLGWWGFPWGPIRTIQAILKNVKNQKTNWLDTPNDYLRSFVLSKIGEIETYKGNQEKLRQIIASD